MQKVISLHWEFGVSSNNNLYLNVNETSLTGFSQIKDPLIFLKHGIL